jgi:hypothetical protein
MCLADRQGGSVWLGWLADDLGERFFVGVP